MGGRLSPGRALAVDALAQVRERGAFLQHVVAKTIRSRQFSQSSKTAQASQRVSREDRAFAEMLATGVVSTCGTLDEAIDRSLSSPYDIQPNVRDALRVSAYELLFLKKPAHVVVDQGVELVKHVERRAGNLANAVLRKMERDSHGFPWGNHETDDAALARMHGFPSWIARLLIERYGREGAAAFMEASNAPAPLFLAVNPAKATVGEVMSELEECGARPRLVGPDAIGCILVGNQRAAVRSQVLADGRAIVSDASAQRTAIVATPAKNKRFLEVGSGRGTKTVLLQGNALKANGEQCDMWCVDIHAFKNGVLSDRVKACGLQSVTILEGDGTRLDELQGLPSSFGKVLIDAPCSGLGTLRRHPEIRWSMTPEKVMALAGTGFSMLQSAAPLVEPGGSIVFSTCTMTRDENENVVERFIASEAGSAFELEPIGGKKYALGAITSSQSADVHFIAKLVRSR